MGIIKYIKVTIFMSLILFTSGCSDSCGCLSPKEKKPIVIVVEESN